MGQNFVCSAILISAPAASILQENVLSVRVLYGPYGLLLHC